MPFSFFVSFLLPLCLAPYWTAHLYARAESWEFTQISVDNAAILLGKADREMLAYVQAANKVLRALEAAHDPLHVCARSPVGETCAAQDAALEVKIAVFHAAVFASAQGMWRASGLAALAYLRAQRVAIREWRRPLSAPLRAKRCRVCGIEWAWEISGDRETWIRAEHEVSIGVGVRPVGESLLGNEKWNYRLMALPEG